MIDVSFLALLLIVDVPYRWMRLAKSDSFSSLSLFEIDEYGKIFLFYLLQLVRNGEGR